MHFCRHVRFGTNSENTLPLPPPRTLLSCSNCDVSLTGRDWPPLCTDRSAVGGDYLGLIKRDIYRGSSLNLNRHLSSSPATSPSPIPSKRRKDEVHKWNLGYQGRHSYCVIIFHVCSSEENIAECDLRPAVEVSKLTIRKEGIRVVAATKHFRHRGDTLNKATITVDLSSPMKDVVEFSASHFLVCLSGLSP